MYQGNHSRYSVIAERRRARAQKRKAVIVSLAMAGVLLVGGTIAWMTASTTDVVNQFSIGNITTQVDEEIENGVKTDVVIENTGTVKAYIRATVVVNWVDAQGAVAADQPVLGTDYEMTVNQSANGWFVQDGYYYWPTAVEGGQKTGVLIESCKPLLEKDGYNLRVDVLASGIQANPTSVVTDEWGVGVSDGTLIPTVSDSNMNA